LYFRTGLHRAARKGNIDTITILQSKGVNLDAQDKDGVTALMYAAYYGHTECVKFLIEQGANVKLLDRKNRDFLRYQIAASQSQVYSVPPDDVLAPEEEQIVESGFVEEEVKVEEIQKSEENNNNLVIEDNANNDNNIFINIENNEVVSGGDEQIEEKTVVVSKENLDNEVNEEVKGEEEKAFEEHPAIVENKGEVGEEKPLENALVSKSDAKPVVQPNIQPNKNVEPEMPVRSDNANLIASNKNIIAARWFRIPFISIIFTTCAALSFVFFFKKSSYFKK
jgi:ankyrin repeat protein